VDNYEGLDYMSKRLKSRVLNSKIQLSGSIDKHCFETYYLSPVEELKSREAFSYWDLTEQDHVRLSGYLKNITH